VEVEVWAKAGAWVVVAGEVEVLVEVGMDDKKRGKE
jgi:hypothetical protein